MEGDHAINYVLMTPYRYLTRYMYFLIQIRDFLLILDLNVNSESSLSEDPPLQDYLIIIILKCTFLSLAIFYNFSYELPDWCMTLTTRT